MTTRITRAVTYDVRFPTSLTLAGSDALNSDPDYSAAYVVLETDHAGAWRRLVSDTQLRWLGPEKGVIHLATAALVNALWDLYAKLEEKPLWKLLADLSPEEIVACVDFRYIRDAVTPEEALELLRRSVSTRAEREEFLLRHGFPAYTTSAGWIGYAEETLPARAQEALAAGFTHLKVKVGADPETDLRRARIIR